MPSVDCGSCLCSQCEYSITSFCYKMLSACCSSHFYSQCEYPIIPCAILLGIFLFRYLFFCILCSSIFPYSHDQVLNKQSLKGGRIYIVLQFEGIQSTTVADGFMVPGVWKLGFFTSYLVEIGSRQQKGGADLWHLRALPQWHIPPVRPNFLRVPWLCQLRSKSLNTWTCRETCHMETTASFESTLKAIAFSRMYLFYLKPTFFWNHMGLHLHPCFSLPEQSRSAVFCNWILSF